MYGIRAAARRIIPAAVCLVLAAAAMRTGAPAAAQAPVVNPALARLEIDVWPESDRASSVLVIIRGEIAADVSLPAKVSVRIPSAAGEPTAVAGAASATDRLVNVAYGRTDVQIDFSTIAFDATTRFFHLEFYDPVETGSPDREYKYLWPGDFAVTQVTVQLQEPAGSSAVSVTPDLGTPAAQSDGMLYRQADLGPLEAGKPLVVDLQYRKTDPRPSFEILGLNQPSAPEDDGGSSSMGTVLLVVAAVVVVGIVGTSGVLVIRQRQAAANAAPVSRVQRRRAQAEDKFCRKCSNALRPDDKFCGACGHPIKAGD